MAAFSYNVKGKQRLFRKGGAEAVVIAIAVLFLRSGKQSVSKVAIWENVIYEKVAAPSLLPIYNVRTKNIRINWHIIEIELLLS